jgi:hypothetical protein
MAMSYRSTANKQMEKLFEWDKWRNEIPYIKFDPEWKVKVIPPFGDAVVRFVVTDGHNTISVYLDCYDNPGHYGSPYWEIYPSDDGDVERYSINDVEHLVEGIRKSFMSLQPKDVL